MSKVINEIKKYFVNPANAETSEDLAKFATEAIRVMAQIYESMGNLKKSDKQTQKWLKESKSSGTLRKIMGDVLNREFSTTRFDQKFMGQIHPQGNKIGILSNLIAAYMNTNTIVKEGSLSEHKMELEAIDWLGNIFGYKKNTFSGNIVTDGTMANLTALWVAREKKSKEIESKKLKSNIKMHVLVNDMRHYSIDKACNILGTNIVLTTLPRIGMKTDVVGTKKIINQIKSRGEEILVLIGLAGETETAEVDRLDELADLAEKYKIFFHVDAAYGGPFIMSRKSGLFKGIDRADSITVDPHKMLYVPYQAGVILFKNKNDHALIQMNARYLQTEENTGLLGDPNERNFGFSARIEGSLGSAGVISTWTSQKLFGKSGFSALLDHTIELTQHCYSLVSNSSILRPIHNPELNTLLIGLAEISKNKIEYNKLIKSVQQAVFKKHGYYVSYNSNVDEGRSALRFVAMHPWTSKEEVTVLVGLIEKETNLLSS